MSVQPYGNVCSVKAVQIAYAKATISIDHCGHHRIAGQDYCLEQGPYDAHTCFTGDAVAVLNLLQMN